MIPAIPNRRRFQIITTYSNLSVPRAITKANFCRGLFMISLTDSLDPLRPRNWSVMVNGGTAFTGINAKYFILDGNNTNISSVTATNPGYEYDMVDAFGNTYHLSFNGARDFTCTIQRTAGAALTGDITLKVLLFAFDDPN